MDPALRAALEKLDAVREKQPTMDDFSVEGLLGRSARKGSVSSSSIAASFERVQATMGTPWYEDCRGADASDNESAARLDADVDAYLAELAAASKKAAREPSVEAPRTSGAGRRGGGPSMPFSTDLLMAAAARTPSRLSSAGNAVGAPNVTTSGRSGSHGRRHAGGASGIGPVRWPPTDASRSTSPGCTQQSLSGSLGGLSCDSASEQLRRSEAAGHAPRPPRDPTAPAAPPPRRPGRQRVLSARGRASSQSPTPADCGPLSAR